MTKLKELRKKRGLTQAQFGKLWGASQNTVSNWENGNSEISNDLLVQFAKYFSVSVDYLLGREDQEQHDDGESSDLDKELNSAFNQLPDDASKQEVIDYIMFKIGHPRK